MVLQYFKREPKIKEEEFDILIDDILNDPILLNSQNFTSAHLKYLLTHLEKSLSQEPTIVQLEKKDHRVMATVMPLCTARQARIPGTASCLANEASENAARPEISCLPDRMP